MITITSVTVTRQHHHRQGKLKLSSMADSSTTAVREGGIFSTLTATRLGMLGSARQCTLESRKVSTTVIAIAALLQQQLNGQQLGAHG